MVPQVSVIIADGKRLEISPLQSASSDQVSAPVSVTRLQIWQRKINGRCDVEQPPSRQPARPATTFGGKYQICCTLDQSSARTREWYLKQPLGAGEQTAGDSLFNRAFQKGFSKGFVTVIRFSNEMHDYASLLYSLVLHVCYPLNPS